MNVLDKIKVVQRGLAECGSDYSMCNKCPYYDRDMCRKGLIREANEVIKALRDELKKRTDKAVEAKSGFITLTNGALYTGDGTAVVLVENSKVVIRMDDILSISDLVDVKGSDVRLNDARQTTFHVCETIEEILAKIAEAKGE